MTEWNPRHLAYANTHSQSPEEMLATDRPRFPGGCMTGFVLWLGERWNDFFLEGDGAVPGNDYRALAVYHRKDAFDAWLNTSCVIPA